MGLSWKTLQTMDHPSTRAGLVRRPRRGEGPDRRGSLSLWVSAPCREVAETVYGRESCRGHHGHDPSSPSRVLGFVRLGMAADLADRNLGLFRGLYYRPGDIPDRDPVHRDPNIPHLEVPRGVPAVGLVMPLDRAGALVRPEGRGSHRGCSGTAHGCRRLTVCGRRHCTGPSQRASDLGASESGGPGRRICRYTWTWKTGEQSRAGEETGHGGEETEIGEDPGQRRTGRPHGRLGRRSDIGAASCRVNVVAVWTHDAIQTLLGVDGKFLEGRRRWRWGRWR